MNCKTCSSDNPSCVRCTVCQKKVFCGDDCRTIGWTIHEADCNVHTVPQSGMSIMLPYYGEDRLEEEDLEDLSPSADIFQNHVVRYADSHGLIEQDLVESRLKRRERSLGRSQRNIRPDVAELNYSIKIEFFENFQQIKDGTGKSWTIDGLNVGNTIVSRNNSTPIYQKLAKARGQTDGYVLWPGQNLIRNKNIMMNAREGFIGTSLMVNGMVVAPISACYEIKPIQKKAVGNLFRKFKRAVGKRLPIKDDYAIKYGGGDPRTPSLETYRIDTRDGNSLQLTFMIPRTSGGTVTADRVQLMDIEYVVAYSGLPPRSDMGDSIEQEYSHAENISLDATKIEHVTALVQAMQYYMSNGDISGVSAQTKFELLNNYRKNLENSILKGTEEPEITPEINVAINEMTHEMINLVGTKYKVSAAGYKKEINSSGSGRAVKLAEDLKTQMDGLREKKKSSVTSSRKGFVRKQMRMLLKVVEDMGNGLRAGEDKDNFQKAAQILRTSMEG